MILEFILLKTCRFVSETMRSSSSFIFPQGCCWSPFQQLLCFFCLGLFVSGFIPGQALSLSHTHSFSLSSDLISFTPGLYHSLFSLSHFNLFLPLAHIS